jgi:hypothetical protein
LGVAQHGLLPMYGGSFEPIQILEIVKLTGPGAMRVLAEMKNRHGQRFRIIRWQQQYFVQQYDERLRGWLLGFGFPGLAAAKREIRLSG